MTSPWLLGPLTLLIYNGDRPYCLHPSNLTERSALPATGVDMVLRRGYFPDSGVGGEELSYP